MNKKIFSFDAETDGLWGNPFAIAAIVYEKRKEKPVIFDRMVYESEPTWVEVDKFIARLPDSVISNNWVRENALTNIPVTHDSYEKMIHDFATFYLMHKQDADCICHMGYIVEAHLLREMHRFGFIGDWAAPYPLHYVSGNLRQAGEDPTSVDKYAEKYGLKITDYGTTHNPLYDCEVTAKVYIHLIDYPHTICG